MWSLVAGLVLVVGASLLVAESDAQRSEYLDIDVVAVYSEWYFLDEGDGQVLMMELEVTNNESFTLRDSNLYVGVKFFVDGGAGNLYWHDGILSELCSKEVETIYPKLTETWYVCFNIPFDDSPHMLVVDYRDGSSVHLVGFSSYLPPCHEEYNDDLCAPYTLDDRPANLDWVNACENENDVLKGALEEWLANMLGLTYGLQLLGIETDEPADCWEGLARSAVDYIDFLHGWMDTDYRFSNFETIEDVFYPEPEIIIRGTNVTWNFQDSKGNGYSWFMPIATFEDRVESGRDLSEYLSYDPLRLDLDGDTIYTTNLSGFVGDSGSFYKVIDGIYDNSHDDRDFVYEVWYVVSQLTVYDEDVHPYSEGRFALETLTRGGGDCEDLAILIADMLVSSKHTEDWSVEYIYMDADNPTDPQTVNHVALRVKDGVNTYLIEPTGAPSWEHYPEGMTGWFFDVFWDGTYS